MVGDVCPVLVVVCHFDEAPSGGLRVLRGDWNVGRTRRGEKLSVDEDFEYLVCLSRPWCCSFDYEYLVMLASFCERPWPLSWECFIDEEGVGDEFGSVVIAVCFRW